MRNTVLFTAMLLLTPTAAWAQDHMGHAVTSVALPEICLANAQAPAAMAMPMAPAAMAPVGDAAHTDLMAGMDAMNADMMAGAGASDIDVAFVCSMIPHHRGAIAMAKAELSHGDDPWVRTLAENVIAAQEQEIAAMLAWLSKQ